jgi:hypothetical protein
VQAEDLVLDEGGEREEIKEVGEVFPNIRITVLAEALVVKAVYLGDLAGLVVATEDGNALGIADLESDKKGNSLDGEVATINIIT